jgi:hypothetical protein
MYKKLIKSFSKRTDLSTSELTEKWFEAEKQTLSEGIDLESSEFYIKTLSTFKKKIGLKEEYIFLEKFRSLLKDS